jgi:hypothetical protein
MTDSLLISRDFTYLLCPEELDLCQDVVVLSIILPLFPLRIITIREHAYGAQPLARAHTLHT